MPSNLSRRKSVMSRSLKLGHCVCNPKLLCPCPIFEEHNVCQCAGEKLSAKQGPVALTKYVRKAGCASKIGQADLLRILGTLPPVTDPNVLLGAAAGDDAGIYKIDDRHSLVLTVDVFTPCVDDPYLFGQIAAANSVSDVYAMGGRPITALSIVGFPIDDLDGAIMEAMLRGGVDKLAEAGCSVIGGHSINDEEIKLGFAVTGLIDPAKVVARDRARVGDVLVLTKPLGTGMISFAAQIGRVSQECLNEVGASMATLNKDAAELMLRHGASACTDITGFGLAGHLVEMVRGSGVSVDLDMSALPVFAAAEACIRNEILPGAIEGNQEYAMAWVGLDAKEKGKSKKAKVESEERGRPEEGDIAFLEESNEANLAVIYDPQTSGGLLIALPEGEAERYVEEMHARGHTATATIGRVVEKDDNRPEGEVVIVNSRLENLIGNREAVIQMTDEETPECCPGLESSGPQDDPGEMPCCSGMAREGGGEAAPFVDGEPTAAESQSMFTEFMKQANKEGLIDRRAKKLMAIALSVAQRCAPCLIIHIKTALEMGITKDEIEEAAWLAISFSGCAGMMFYKDVCAQINF